MRGKKIKKVGWILLIAGLMGQNLSAKPIQFTKDRVVDVPVKVQKGTSLVELKIVAQMMDLEIVWEAKDKSIRLKDAGNELLLYVGQAKGSFNGGRIEVGQAPIVVEGRTYIPLRTVVENFGYKLGSQDDTLILSRTLSVEEQVILEKWEKQRVSYRGIVNTIEFYKKEGKVAELPLKETISEIEEAINNVNTTIGQSKTSSLLKVLGKEYISTFKAFKEVCMIAKAKEEAYKKVYNVAVYKSDYLAEEYLNIISREAYTNKLVEQEYTTPEYDEVRVQVGYTHYFKVLREQFKEVNMDSKEQVMPIGFISYRISMAVQQRETLKYMEKRLRSPDAKEVFGQYIAYADIVIGYYCDMRRNLNTPNKVNEGCEASIEKVGLQIDKAYEKYVSVGKENR